MGILSGLLGILLSYGTLIYGFFLNLVGLLTSALLQLAVSILNFALSPNAISLSYTNPAGNPFIAAGWELTRGLTNIVFVLALIAIGLGTALRLTGYQVKKALPLLILVALLINFTPVLLGILVDATNIVMNFFLVNGFAGGNVFYNQMSLSLGSWISGLGRFWDPSTQINTMLGLIVINIFNVVAALVIFLFAFLFIARYVAIWLLVILSPLAFAAYILPATRKYWNIWWTQFIQWSIIGIFASFFLYLSDQIIKIIMVDKVGITQAPGNSGLGLINMAVPWGVALGFLFVGFILSMSSSAMGSNIITTRAAKVQTWVRSKAQQTAGATARGAAVGTAAGAAAGWKGGTGIGKVRRGIMGAFGGALKGGLTPEGQEQGRKWYKKRLEQARIAAPGSYEAELDRERKRAGKNLETMGPDAIRQIMSRTAVTRDDRLRRARGLEILAEKGWISKDDIDNNQDAFSFGVGKNQIYNRLPNADPKIKERVEGMDTEEFRKNIVAGAFETPVKTGAPAGTPPTYTNEQLNVFYSMDMAKTQELGKQGKKTSKAALRRLIIAREPDITAKIAALRATRNPDDKQEADRIENMWMEIANSPNYA